MRLFSRELALIFKKEVVHCVREPHVLAVTILMPMLIYPIMFIAVSETMLMQQGRAEKTVCTVGIKMPMPLDLSYLCAKLATDSKIVFKNVPDPDAELKNGGVDAVISQKRDGAKLEVKLARNGEVADILKSRIESGVDELRTKSLGAYAQFKDKPEGLLERPQITVVNEGSPFDSVMPVVAAVILGFAISGIATGASYPTVAVLIEERVKQTAQTTLLLPVSHFTLVTGKYLAVSFLALISGVINLVSLVLVLGVIMSQMPPDASGEAPSLSAATVMVCSVILPVTLVLSALSVSALNFLVISPARSLKEAQSRATLLVLFTSVPAIFAVFPNIDLNPQLALVPLLNVALLLKAVIQDSAGTMDFVVVTAEVLLSTAAILFIASRYFIHNQTQEDQNSLFRLEPTRT